MKSEYDAKLQERELKKLAEEEALEAAMRPDTPFSGNDEEAELHEHFHSQFTEEELAAAAEHTGESVEELRSNKKKMGGLHDYVNAHTSRKLIDEWNYISGNLIYQVKGLA